jgi:hypothetical protein
MSLPWDSDSEAWDLDTTDWNTENVGAGFRVGLGVGVGVRGIYAPVGGMGVRLIDRGDVVSSFSVSFGSSVKLDFTSPSRVRSTFRSVNMVTGVAGTASIIRTTYLGVQYKVGLSFRGDAGFATLLDVTAMRVGLGAGAGSFGSKWLAQGNMTVALGLSIGGGGSRWLGSGRSAVVLSEVADVKGTFFPTLPIASMRVGLGLSAVAKFPWDNVNWPSADNDWSVIYGPASDVWTLVRSDSQENDWELVSLAPAQVWIPD